MRLVGGCERLRERWRRKRMAWCVVAAEAPADDDDGWRLALFGA